MRSPITMSALPRLDMCIGGVFLPPDPPISNDDAEKGNARDTFLDAIVDGLDAPEALALVPPAHRNMCAGIDMEKFPRGYKSQRAYAINPRTHEVRALELAGPRAYPDIGPDWICGTLDMDPVSGDDPVIDRKGQHDKTCPRARDNIQLHAQMLARGVNHGALMHIRDDGTWWLDRVVWTMADRERAWLRCLAVIDTPADAILSAGPHCRYCPARLGCPESQRTVNALETTSTEARMISQIRTDPESVVQFIGAAKQIVSAVTAQLRMAYPDGFRMVDGLWYGPRKSERETIDGDVAFRVISETFGTEYALHAVEKTTSKDAIKRVAHEIVDVEKKAGRKATIKATSEKILDAVRNAGGSEFKPVEKWEPHERKVTP